LKETIARNARSLTSQGANLDFLGDGRTTEYMKLWKYLIDTAITHHEKIERLVRDKIVDSRKDKRILNFFQSMPADKWREISAHLQKQAPERGEIISIILVDGQPEIHDGPRKTQVQALEVRGIPNQKQIRSHCESIMDKLCQAKKLVNAGGKSHITGNNFYLQGKGYCTYFLKPVCGDGVSIAVKIPVISDMKKINLIATKELAVLKKLHAEGVPNVVEPYGNECLRVKEDNGDILLIVASKAKSSDQTDRKALQLIDYNGLHSVVTQILRATFHIHRLDVVHGNLADISNLVFDHINLEICLAGWSSSQILDTESSDNVRKLKSKDTKDVAKLILSLIARRKDGEEVVIPEDGDLSDTLASSVSAFNNGVWDPNLRLDPSSAIVTVSRHLFEGSLSLGAALDKIQLQTSPGPTKFTFLPVRPRYLLTHDTVTFPTDIKVKKCVDNKGNEVEQCGIFAQQKTPKNAILGPYEGIDVTTDYRQRLETADPRLDFHLLSLPGGGAKASFRRTIEGNPRNNTIQDVYALQASGAVHFPCYFRSGFESFKYDKLVLCFCRLDL
jgi:hypothetical protein